MPKIKFSKTVVKSVKHSYNREILQSETSLPNLRKEINRIFQQANRRLQNIEKSGVFSPAAAALDFDTDRFAKFSTAGKNWNEIKLEYAKAIKFLQQPTSTASGAKQYLEYVAENAGFDKRALKNKDFSEKLNRVLKGEGTILSLQNEVGDSPQKFAKALNDAWRMVSDVSEQIENAADKITDYSELENALNSDMRNYMDLPKDALGVILDGLHDLGL